MRNWLVLTLVFVTGTAATARNIGPGFDLFKTQPTGFWDFSEAPIDGGFFGPGSDPFDGRINYVTRTKGVRGKPAEFLNGEPVTVETEIVALSLHSVEPIRVTSSGGDGEFFSASAADSFFDVFVTLDTRTPSVGQYILQHNDVAAGEPDGGMMIDSFFDVFFEIEFTPVGGGQTLSLQRRQLLTLAGPVPWSHTGPRQFDHGGTGGFLLGVDPFAGSAPDGPMPQTIRYQGDQFTWDFRLARVPEPATLALLALGAAALRRRRRVIG